MIKSEVNDKCCLLLCSGEECNVIVAVSNISFCRFFDAEAEFTLLIRP